VAEGNAASAEGSVRLLRYNDDLTRWDGGDGDERRRSLDVEHFGLRLEPVSAADSGTYICLINNRREPDAHIVLTVQGKHECCHVAYVHA
jgi:hypothetical protein